MGYYSVDFEFFVGKIMGGPNLMRPVSLPERKPTTMMGTVQGPNGKWSGTLSGF